MTCQYHSLHIANSALQHHAAALKGCQHVPSLLMACCTMRGPLISGRCCMAIRRGSVTPPVPPLQQACWLPSREGVWRGGVGRFYGRWRRAPQGAGRWRLSFSSLTLWRWNLRGAHRAPPQLSHLISYLSAACALHLSAQPSAALRAGTAALHAPRFCLAHRTSRGTSMSWGRPHRDGQANAALPLPQASMAYRASTRCSRWLPFSRFVATKRRLLAQSNTCAH